MNLWIKQNAWHLITTAGLLAVMAGQVQERQTNVASEVARLERRVSVIEGWHGLERQRLDPLYMSRELATAQQAEIIRRLEVIETELRGLRRGTR